jgi:hypothetical protein
MSIACRTTAAPPMRCSDTLEEHTEERARPPVWGGRHRRTVADTAGHIYAPPTMHLNVDIWTSRADVRRGRRSDFSIKPCG